MIGAVLKKKSSTSRPKRDEAFAKAFGELLRTVREKRDMTQLALAEKLRTDPNYIGRFERGERIPGWQQVIVLARALSVPTDSLVPEGY